MQASNGGTLNISGSGAVSAGAETVLYNATLNISGGSYSQLNGSNFDVGWGGSSVLNQNGGTVNVSGVLQIANAGSTGVYNLSGGTLQTAAVIDNQGGGTNVSAFQFNGGTLKANSNQGNFIDGGLNAVTVGNGGGTIDSNGFSVTVSHSLDAVQVLNANSGGQSLTGITPQSGEGTGYTSTPNVYITGGGGAGTARWQPSVAARSPASRSPIPVVATPRLRQSFWKAAAWAPWH